MRVLYLTNMYPADDRSTFGIFVQNHVRELQSRGHEIKVAGITDPGREKKKVLAKYLSFAGKSLLAGISGKFDLIHVHYIFPTGLLGLALQKIKRTPMVVTAHGGDVDEMSARSGFNSRWTKTILHRCDAVIAVSPDLAGKIESRFEVPGDKISVINMGVDLDKFRPLERRAARNELGLAEDETIILFVGNLIPDKGLPILLKAFSSLPATRKWRLVAVGKEKKKEELDKIRELIRDLNLDDRVTLAGTVPQARVAGWMSVADLFVLPSLREGFGLVALEAMACRCPVIASRVGGLPDFINGENGLLFEPGDHVELAEEILKVACDPELAASMAEKGLATARENSLPNQVGKVIEVYEKVMKLG